MVDVARMIVVGAAVATACTLPAHARDGVHNGGFEQGLTPGEPRPRHWHLGFPGELEPMPGEWALVAGSAGGSTALEVTCRSAVATCVAAQIADLPAGVMDGEELRFSVAVRRDRADGWVGAQVAAVNPEVEVDPVTGIPHVGFVQLVSTEAGWSTLEGRVTLDGPAQLIAVVLFVDGEDATGAFDDVRLETDLELPGCAPWPHAVVSPGRPPFPFGITNENPRNGSDRAAEDLLARAAEIGDLVNLFAHVRWNGLADKPLLDGHERVLADGRRAAELGLERMLTLDFTHADVDGLGDINPWPDGTPVERLDAATRAAYVDELFVLADAVSPSIVSVGIETDFFWDAHADEWDDFRTMLCDAYARLKSVDPEVHVTTYFTLPSLVRDDLSPDVEGQAALRDLEPCIDSVGYSYYPSDGTTHVDEIPAGMFTAASRVVPELPLIVPEFGYRSDAPYSETEQEAFLRRVLDELRGADVVAAVWYSLYDQTYLGAPPFFQEWFRSIGLIHLDGTPKRSLALLGAAHRDHPPPVVWPRIQCRIPPRELGGRRAQ